MCGLVLIHHNGPAIKGGCVADRTEAGARKPDAGIVLVSSRSERSMARVFAAMQEFFGPMSCRGTQFIEFREVVKLQFEFEITGFLVCQGFGFVLVPCTICKNRVQATYLYCPC